MSKRKLVKFVADINASDEKQVEHQFNIAFVLTAIRDLKLYEHGDYANFSDLVASELYFSPDTAYRMISLHTSYTRLRYKKEEFLLLMRQFGWRKLERALAGATRKMGHRAIKNWHGAQDENNKQFNMHVHDKKLTARIEAALSRFGMEETDNGRRTNLTNAFIALLDDYERLTKVAEDKEDSKLKAVA